MTTSTQDPVLSVKGLTIAFGNRVVIRDLSFHVHAGECMSIIGPNGSGKTVLLEALLGLIPFEGRIHWRPEARLGYVPQRVAADRQLPLRVSDLLAAKARVLGLSATDLPRVCDEVGLASDVLDSRIGALSGGQFQKTLIAFAMLGQPNVLLFDEPTASLDELSEEHIYDLLDNLRKSTGITLILVSHDLSIVFRYASTVLCLSKATTCLGPPRDILTPEMLAELYGAPPKYHGHTDGREQH